MNCGEGLGGWVLQIMFSSQWVMGAQAGQVASPLQGKQKAVVKKTSFIPHNCHLAKRGLELLHPIVTDIVVVHVESQELLTVLQHKVYGRAVTRVHVTVAQLDKTRGDAFCCHLSNVFAPCLKDAS